MNATWYARTGILVAFWVMCLAIAWYTIAIGVELNFANLGWLGLPYVLVAVLAWFFRRNDAAVSGLLLAVLLVGAFGSLIRYAMLEEHLRVLRVEAVMGRRGMNC